LPLRVRRGSTYRAVNSCIQFLPTLDGTALITVEDLADGGNAAPVQQAMVDCHGSQCGFCTPGFVMALFALWHEDKAPTRARIEEALAGNLCRCNGYRRSSTPPRACTRARRAIASTSARTRPAPARRPGPEAGPRLRA
jgi:xanthine dehydrogenase small subunit